MNPPNIDNALSRPRQRVTVRNARERRPHILLPYSSVLSFLSGKHRPVRRVSP